MIIPKTMIILVTITVRLNFHTVTPLDCWCHNKKFKRFLKAEKENAHIWDFTVGSVSHATAVHSWVWIGTANRESLKRTVKMNFFDLSLIPKRGMVGQARQRRFIAAQQHQRHHSTCKDVIFLPCFLGCSYHKRRKSRQSKTFQPLPFSSKICREWTK